jgi:CheY-like chemotaxis protein
VADPERKIILFIDDDEDDYLLFKEILGECRKEIDLQWINDSERVVAHLLRAGETPERPDMIVLDLNMPKLNGRELLRMIRGNEALRHIPVSILTNSINRLEAQEAYRLGVNSFLRKPSGYKDMLEFANTFCRYWFDYSTLS